MASFRTVSPMRLRVWIALLFAALALCLLVAAPAAHAQTKARKDAGANKVVEDVDADKLFAAIVKLSVQAVPDARSAATLGSEREGSGVVIGDHGLILTIGYLIV